MSETVTFWLDNKNCAGARVAAIGARLLVLYRDRYFVVTAGVAETKGGKPLRYSMSSLPAPWKLAMKGVAESPGTVLTETDALERAEKPKVERKKKERTAMIEEKQEPVAEQVEALPRPTIKAPKKSESKPPSQPPVVANCPYCNTTHEIPLEKGKNGKPFFIPCSRCMNEFAVRLVQVTIYQAQVAGFR